jgi:hypothetical protein
MTRSLIQDSRCPYRDLKQTPPEYESSALPLCNPARPCGVTIATESTEGKTAT